MPKVTFGRDFRLASAVVVVGVGDIRRTVPSQACHWGAGSSGRGHTASAPGQTACAADPRCLIDQFAEPSRPRPQALAAANFVAIAAGFTGSTKDGMSWLIEHARTEGFPLPSRNILAETVRLADPREDWATLRAAPGGEAISVTWELRRKPLPTIELFWRRPSTSTRTLYSAPRGIIGPKVLTVTTSAPAYVWRAPRL